MIHSRQTKTGIRYDVRLRDPSDRLYSKSFRTKKDAIAYEAGERTDRARGLWVDPRGATIPFEDWAKQWLDSDGAKRPKTKHTDRGIIDRELASVFGSRPIGSITRLDVQRLANDWAERFKPSTVHRYRAVLAAIMNAAVDSDLIGKSPCRNIRIPQIQPTTHHSLTVAEIQMLAATVGVAYSPMLFLGTILGLRFSECAAIRIGDVDFLRQVVHIRTGLVEAGGHLAEGAPKSASSRRSMAAPKALIEMLSSHLAVRGLTAADSDERLFVAPTGTDLRYSNFRARVWVPAVKSCKLDGIGFHDLRRSSATALVALGTDIRTAHERLGHSDPMLTLRLYAQVSDDRDQAAAEKLGDHFLTVPEADDQADDASAV